MCSVCACRTSYLIPSPMCSMTLDSETSLAWKGFLFSLNSCARQMRQPSLGTPTPISLGTYLLMRSAVDFSPHSVLILAAYDGKEDWETHFCLQNSHLWSTRVNGYILCIPPGAKAQRRKRLLDLFQCSTSESFQWGETGFQQVK